MNYILSLLLLFSFTNLQAYNVSSNDLKAAFECQNDFLKIHEEYTLKTSKLFGKYDPNFKVNLNNLLRDYNNCKRKIDYIKFSENINIDVIAPNTNRTLRKQFNHFLDFGKKFIKKIEKNQK